MSQIITTLSGSTYLVGQFPHKVRLCSSTPLAALSQLFPTGILIYDPLPNLLIGEWECYEVVILPTLNTCDLTIALFQPDTPTALCQVWLEWGIVALPIDWVEVRDGTQTH